MTGLSKYRGIGILLARVTVGWVFFYAGIEKVFGATPFTAAGFLKFGTLGTTAEKVADGTIVNPTHAFCPPARFRALARFTGTTSAGTERLS